jgi:hypothetical protein
MAVSAVLPPERRGHEEGKHLELALAKGGASAPPFACTLRWMA